MKNFHPRANHSKSSDMIENEERRWNKVIWERMEWVFKISFFKIPHLLFGRVKREVDENFQLSSY